MVIGRNDMFAKQYYIWAFLLAAHNILQQQYYICKITIGQ